MPSQEKTVEEDIIKEVCLELGMPFAQVRELVINGQFAYVKHVMESNTFDGVRLPYAGVFQAKHKHMQIVKRKQGMNKHQQRILDEQIRRGLVFEKKFKTRKEDLLPIQLNKK